MSKHTSGPYHIWTGDIAVLIQNRDDPLYPINVANVYRNDPNGSAALPWEANARLLTSAPDLLAACEEAIDRIEDLVEPLECECQTCEECGKMPRECTGTECAKTCSCSECDACRSTATLAFIRAALARAGGE